MDKQQLKFLFLISVPVTIPANQFRCEAGSMEGPLFFVCFAEYFIIRIEVQNSCHMLTLIEKGTPREIPCYFPDRRNLKKTNKQTILFTPCKKN